MNKRSYLDDGPGPSKDIVKTGRRTRLYRYRSGTIPVRSGPEVFRTERDTVNRYTGRNGITI
ncbi:hypothetical protein KY290_008238 [Solanum tuberosum]|uniref:Uncharacterized protein n=1 Tax=Solanum tuberosum TaxID=4113 RepID=A0ABQ7W7W4_SOLTU|nr:hypothetical protein KY290_008238 [Solanum tuberosum]